MEEFGKGLATGPLADDSDHWRIPVIGRDVQDIEDAQQASILNEGGGACSTEEGRGSWVIGIEQPNRHLAIEDLVMAAP
jgi:hypothetical protein